jgi:hypothetical protein
MKLVKIDDKKIGLFVLLPKGPYAVDIVSSLGILAPRDPISIGLLNGALKDDCNWHLLVKHWAYLRSPLKRLARTATANPDHPCLVLQPITGDLHPGHAAAPIVAIEITDIETLEGHDPTGRRAMERQFMSPSVASSLQTTGGETSRVFECPRSIKADSQRR